MSAIAGLGAFGWLTLALCLALWARPSAWERETLGPIAARLLLPGSDWRGAVPPVHWEAFVALRRRLFAAGALATASLALLLGLVLVQPGGEAGVPDPVVPRLVAPGVTANPVPAPPETRPPEAPARQQGGGGPVASPPGPRPPTARGDLFGSVRLRPAYAEGVVEGLRISGLPPGSAWLEIGARNGDVILEANGRAMNSRSASISLMETLGSADDFVLRVRGVDGAERILESTIAPARQRAPQE